jgi:hypothetical protein
MLWFHEPRKALIAPEARELLAQEPQVLRVVRAWIDDSELCLEVECRLRDGSTSNLEMLYCWERKYRVREDFYRKLVAWLLNNQWVEFFQFVQTRFTEELTAHATNPAYPQTDED